MVLYTWRSLIGEAAGASDVACCEWTRKLLVQHAGSCGGDTWRQLRQRITRTISCEDVGDGNARITRNILRQLERDGDAAANAWPCCGSDSWRSAEPVEDRHVSDAGHPTTLCYAYFEANPPVSDPCI
ncbi:hypothetical protein Scep_005607 [Stephania cephalantha]|uniref:Uncharacterized protein n=1 Tax=Stephania cephalantha TaxID=152367 RepID=A0AAP0KW27_9MAGN